MNRTYWCRWLICTWHEGKGKVRSFGVYSALQPIRSIVPSPLKLPSFTTRGAVYQPDTQRTLLAEEGTIRISSTISEIYEDCCVLLHAPKLGHGTDYFTSPPKEGMLWIFPARKIRRLWLGANPRSWVPEASMLTTRPPKPLVHGMIDCNEWKTGKRQKCKNMGELNDSNYDRNCMACHFRSRT
jgi:hypothetical protein